MLHINQKGFSLLEIMVAIAIFVIAILAAMNIFKNAIDTQRNAVAAQNTQESMRYVFEVISKELRLAKESNTECDSIVTFLGFSGGPASSKLYHSALTADGNNVLYFKNKDDECVAYYIESDTNGISRLKVFRDDISDGLDNTSFYITPDEINVNSFDFNIIDNPIGAINTLQPRVTIRIGVEANSSQDIYRQTMNMQTTVSSRYYE